MILGIYNLLRAQTLKKGLLQWQLITTAGQELVKMYMTRGIVREGGTWCALPAHIPVWRELELGAIKAI